MNSIVRSDFIFSKRMCRKLLNAERMELKFLRMPIANNQVNNEHTNAYVQAILKILQVSAWLCQNTPKYNGFEHQIA